MSGIQLVALAPHPPIIIASVGRGDREKVARTVAAMEELSREIAALDPDTIVLISPHGPIFQDAVAVFDGETLEGDLSNFGASGEKVKVQVDTEFIDHLEEKSREGPVSLLRVDLQESHRYHVRRSLDHGALVPMLYLKEAGVKAKYVNMTFGLYPYGDLYELGYAVQQTAAALNRKVVVLASGDLSHCLIPGAPGGFRREGKVFDETLVEILAKGTLEELFSLDPDLIEKAGECGFRSLVLALGALEGREFTPRILSYEGPFGVGYLVAAFSPTGQETPSLLDKLRSAEEKGLARARKAESFPAALARKTLETYVRTGKKPDPPPPAEMPPEFRGKAGVFVSLKKKGQLRGCIGTTEATAANIPREIMQNTISAGIRDPRFPPVGAHELEELSYSVDILGEPEEVQGLEDLDPAAYGVIVEARGKRGLLLPDLPGVDTAGEQVGIASRKAGIKEGEQVRLYRFKVDRYY